MSGKLYKISKLPVPSPTLSQNVIANSYVLSTEQLKTQIHYSKIVTINEGWPVRYGEQ